MKLYWTKLADIPEYNISQIWLMWCKNGRCYEFQQWSFWLMWPGKVSQTLEWHGRLTWDERDVSRENNGSILWLSTFPSFMTLTLDFQGQMLKMLYLRNRRADWHGTKRMWVDRMLHPLGDFQLWPQPWPWPLIFKVKFWKSPISGMGWPIDMGWKGCESIECWNHVMHLNLPLTHDLDLGFSRSNFEKVVSQEWDGWFTWNERDVSRYDVAPTLWLSTLTSTMTLTFNFQGQILKNS